MYPWYDYKPSLMSSEFSMDTDFENCGVTSTTDDPLLKMPSLSNEKSSFDHVSSTSDSTEKDSTRLENEDFDSKYNFVISKESRRAGRFIVIIYLFFLNIIMLIILKKKRSLLLSLLLLLFLLLLLLLLLLLNYVLFLF